MRCREVAGGVTFADGDDRDRHSSSRGSRVECMPRAVDYHSLDVERQLFSFIFWCHSSDVHPHHLCGCLSPLTGDLEWGVLSTSFASKWRAFHAHTRNAT